eukprot:350856-Chlamydomonas_euryale.AAC.12
MAVQLGAWRQRRAVGAWGQRRAVGAWRKACCRRMETKARCRCMEKGALSAHGDKGALSVHWHRRPGAAGSQRLWEMGCMLKEATCAGGVPDSLPLTMHAPDDARP